MKNINNLNMQDKIEATLRCSLPMFPAETKNEVKAMLTPQKLAIITATMNVWAEYAKLKLSVTKEASELFDFITMSLRAKSKADLNNAAHHFNNAVNLSGISTISGLLLRTCMRPARVQRGHPNSGV